MNRTILTVLLCMAGVMATAQQSFCKDIKDIDVTKKISILENAVSVIKKEISRDQKISSWVLSPLALTQTRELLKKDLPEKEKILKDLKQEFTEDPDTSILLIKGSIKKEKKIVNALPIDTFYQQIAKNTINEGLPAKKKILEILEAKLKELNP